MSTKEWLNWKGGRRLREAERLAKTHRWLLEEERVAAGAARSREALEGLESLKEALLLKHGRTGRCQVAAADGANKKHQVAAAAASAQRRARLVALQAKFKKQLEQGLEAEGGQEAGGSAALRACQVAGGALGCEKRARDGGHTRARLVAEIRNKLKVLEGLQSWRLLSVCGPEEADTSANDLEGGSGGREFVMEFAMHTFVTLWFRVKGAGPHAALEHSAAVNRAAVEKALPCMGAANFLERVSGAATYASAAGATAASRLPFILQATGLRVGCALALLSEARHCRRTFPLLASAQVSATEEGGASVRLTFLELVREIKFVATLHLASFAEGAHPYGSGDAVHVHVAVRHAGNPPRQPVTPSQIELAISAACAGDATSVFSTCSAVTAFLSASP
eukprot:jgi/Mesen1/8407/ME000047S07947